MIGHHVPGAGAMRLRLMVFRLVYIITVVTGVAGVLSVERTSANGGGPASRTLLVGGVERVVHVTVPASVEAALSQAEAAPVPLVIALHTTASSGKAMAAMTGLDEAAEAGGFIVAYP